jgi:hypothetical protein
MNTEKSLLPLIPIFAPAEGGQSNACLNWLSDPFEVYVMGYKEAADSLINQVMESGSHQDILVFPICFLYRQYIELRLKEVIRSGRLLLDEPDGFPQHHNLQKLWPVALGVLKKVYAEDLEPEDDLALAAHVVEQFSSVDQGSFAFRYPTDKSGNNPLDGIRHINLYRVAEYVNAFAEVMDAGSMGISVYLDQKSEIASHYAEFQS